MDPIFGEIINQMVKDCVRQREVLDEIIEDCLEASDKFKNGYKRRGLLLELRIITWNTILIQLEKKLLAYPIW